MIQYCLPITATSQEQVLKTIDESRGEYQFFEVWLDYLDDLDDAFVDNLASLYGESIILLFRRKGLEHIRLSMPRREFFIRELSGTAAYLDLDITTQQNEIEFITRERLSLRKIISYHNYELTPADAELEKILDAIGTHSPAVIKIATMCRCAEDAVRLLQWGLRLKAQKKEYIVLGMGPWGAATRIFGTLWGNKVIFAPHGEADASAPGQLSLAQLREIFKALRLE